MSKIFLKSNLSEKQIETDIATYFGWASSESPFRLLDTNEQLTGADKKFYDGGLAIFMQFKVSNGLKSASDVILSTRKNKGKEELIREYRYNNNLNDNPTFFFELREKSQHSVDFQHNILMKNANTHWSQAFYVAPTHLNAHDYFNSLCNSTSKCSLTSPFYFRNEKYFHQSWISHVGRVPFLNEHVSIVPTERVITHKHCYSYSKSGSDIAWHSPSIITRGVSRLSDQLKLLFKQIIEKDNFLTLSEIDKNFDVEGEFSNKEDSYENIANKAKILYEQSDIKTYLLLSNREYIKEIKSQL